MMNIHCYLGFLGLFSLGYLLSVRYGLYIPRANKLIPTFGAGYEVVPSCDSEELAMFNSILSQEDIFERQIELKF